MQLTLTGEVIHNLSRAICIHNHTTSPANSDIPRNFKFHGITRVWKSPLEALDRMPPEALLSEHKFLCPCFTPLEACLDIGLWYLSGYLYFLVTIHYHTSICYVCVLRIMLT